MARNNIQVLAEIDITTQKFLKKLSDAQNAINALTVKQEKLSSQCKENSKLYIQNAADIEKYNQTITVCNNLIKDRTIIYDEDIKRQKLINDALSSTAETESNYINQCKELIKIRSTLNEEDKNFTANLDNINKKLKENIDWLSKRAADKATLSKIDSGAKEDIANLEAIKNKISDLTKIQQILTKVGLENTSYFNKNNEKLKDYIKTANEYEDSIDKKINLLGEEISKQQYLDNVIAKKAKTEQEAIDQNNELIELRKQLNIEDENYAANLGEINTKINQNNTFIANSGKTLSENTKSFNDYKKQVADSFDQINIFNGGLGGLITRAKEAGGVGPMVTGAFQGMSQGIMGMTRSALTFIATPLGLILAAIVVAVSLVKNAMDRSTGSADKISKIFSTFSVITDKLMALLTPLGEYLINGIAAGFEMAGKVAEGAMSAISGALSFLGFDDAAESVKEFTEDVKNTAAETYNLKKAQEALGVQMAIQEEKNEKAKQDAEALTEIAEDQKKSEEERLQALKEAAKIETNNLNERKRLAEEAYDLAIRDAALKRGLSKEEIADLKECGVAYSEKMLAAKGFTQEEIDALSKANIKRMQLQDEERQQLQSHKDAEQKIRDDSEAKREAQAEKWRQKEEARKKAAEKARQDALDIQKLELDKFIADQGIKAKTMQQELDFAEQVSKKKIALINAEFDASDKSEKAKLQRDIALQEVENDLARERAEVAVDNAQKELQEYINTSQSKIQEGKYLSEELANQEKARLDDIAAKQKEFQATRLAQGVIDEEEYKAAIKQVDDENEAAKQDVEKQRKDADDARKAIDLENKRAVDTANMDYDLGFQLDKLDAQKQQELEAAEATGADKQAIEDKYAKMEKDTRKAVMDNKLDLANQTFGALQSIVGKESAAGKAMAVAQATIDTYKSAVSAYASMSGIPVVGPALGAVAAAAAVAAGIANVKKITSTKPPKTPKAEKGALFNIGGRRHSAGGTMFTGEDGTAFEAEQGELIGVMNRNAARHFMAFNNAFPSGAGTAPNYFASGGIVSREISAPGLNVDELASKIAMANSAMPAPVVAVEDIITQSNSYVRVRDGANF